MLTAHLPAGYVLARGLPSGIRWGVPVVLIASVFPDFDMIFFHLVDDRSIHHHRYWVHVPAFWLAVAAVSLPLLHRVGLGVTGLAALAALFLHMFLDTIGGGILWYAPFSDELVTLITVPATQGHWIISFILHWTFLLELAIWGLAIFLWLRRKQA